MAGKTFPGIGDLEDESAPLDLADAADTGATPAPAGQYYSGPTVVDDVKVEEGLKKLRALDAPPGAVTSEVDTALEITESGGHEMPGYRPSFFPGAPAPDGARGTLIGRSVADPVQAPAEREKPFDDRMRATLYGHMMHVPDLSVPSPEQPATQELALIDRSAPTAHAVEIYQPGASRRAAAGIPEPDSYPERDRYRSIPIEVETTSRGKVIVRTAIGMATIAAIIGAGVLWMRTNADEGEPPMRRTIAPPRLTEPPPAERVRPPVDIVPIRPLVPSPSGAAATARAAVPPPAPEPSSAEATDTGIDRPPAEHPKAAPEHSRAAATPAGRPEHRRTGGSASPDGTPSRGRSGKKPSVEDDPDGTLAPSIE